MYEIELDKARTTLGELIQTALGGEEVVIMENGKPILKLVRVSSPAGPVGLFREDQQSVKPHRQSGSAKGLITMSDDFDEPLDDFDAYM
jgi:antitoxin (DNA-binding transcriptional repressor) of toxin-antitoxin stability system